MLPVKELVVVGTVIALGWAIVRVEMVYRYYYRNDQSAAYTETVDGTWNVRVKESK